jgi:hypothetical protein
MKKRCVFLISVQSALLGAGCSSFKVEPLDIKPRHEQLPTHGLFTGSQGYFDLTSLAQDNKKKEKIHVKEKKKESSLP